MAAVTENTETAILARIIMPEQPSFSPDAARSILSLTFNQGDRARMDVLAEKARQGTLTPDEETEIENYERVGHFLSLMQSKARVSLRKASDPS